MRNHFFLSTYKESLTKKDHQLLSFGLHVVKKSIDPVHGLGHIKNLRDAYLAFKKDMGNSVFLDDRVMAHSIVFHDVWKAQAERSKFFLKVILDEYYEGLRSANIYKNLATKFKIDKTVINKVTYAITKHSTGTMSGRRSNEAKLLFDLDELEFFNIDRFKEGLKSFKFGIGKQLAAAKAYFKLRSVRGFYFDWSATEFEKRKITFLEGLTKIRKQATL